MVDSNEHRGGETGSGSSLNVDEIDLHDYWRMIAGRYRFILTVAVFAALAAILLSFFMPKIYCASATIVPPVQESSSLSLLKNLAGNLGPLVGGITDNGPATERYIGILKSRAVADAIVDKFDLMKVYGVSTGFRVDAIGKLANGTRIILEDGNIIRIKVEDTDPLRAAAIANAYIEQLDKYNRKLTGSQATSKREFIESRLKEVEAKLAHPDNMLARETQMQQMLYELLVREYETAKIEEAKNLPTILVLDPATVPERKIRPARMQMGLGAGIAGLILAVCAVFVMDAKTRKR
jgi:uncharacterized protein involved in exopolysaccharide biosynthesis